MTTRLTGQIKPANGGEDRYILTENLRCKFLRQALRRRCEVWATDAPHPDCDRAFWELSDYRIIGVDRNGWFQTAWGTAYGWSIGWHVDIWQHITIDGKPFNQAFERFAIRQGYEPTLPKQPATQCVRPQKRQPELFTLKSERAELMAIAA